MGMFSRSSSGGEQAKGASRRVQRTFENLPSMAMIPLPNNFEYPAVVHMVNAEAPDKELVCLVAWGWECSEDEAFQQIELTWDFADNPKLAVMRFPKGDQIIIRSSFIKSSAAKITASTISELANQLSNLAKSKGLHVKTVT